jgi:hypothetical protein
LKTRPWVTVLVDSVAVFLLAAVLIWPLFRLEYLDSWGSIESTFIADARFLNDHWPHPKWQPLWYCGTRWDYIYPPALRYGTAALARACGISTARAYHLYTALFYCLGIAGVYLLVRLGSGSRGAAWLAAAAAAVLSPAFLFKANIREDVAHYFFLPQRLNALVRYGEGPHISAVACLGLALAASWRALERWRPWALALAGVGAALVVSNNFYGAAALAIFFPVLLWALWVTHRDRGMWLRAAGIAALACALTAFWLTPSYLRVTLYNMRLVSEPGNAWSRWLALGVAALFCLASWKLARGRRAAAWVVFTAGACLFMGLNVLGNHYFKFRVMGEPERLAPELDLVIILLAVEALRRLWAWRPETLPLGRLLAVGVAVAGLWQGHDYVANAWKLYPPAQDYRQRVEYRLTAWLAQNAPEARVAASGSLRFWFNAWHDLAQLGGGSEQGVLNGMVIPPQWEIALGETAEPSVLWLQSLGVDAVGVHEKNSEEVYHDIVHTGKFQGALPVLHDDGRGNVLYRVPRRFPGLARVVERARADTLKPFRSNADLEDLRPYAEWVEKGPDSPAVSRWEGTDALRIRATVREGEAILVQVSYDPCWRAYSGERRLVIRQDVVGFMLVEAPPGTHDLRLVFGLPLENAVGRVVTALGVAALVWLVALGYRRREGAA